MLSKTISILKTENNMCIFKFRECLFFKCPGKGADEGTTNENIHWGRFKRQDHVRGKENLRS